MFAWTFVCVCTCGMKGRATLGLTCVASRQQLVPGVAQVAHLEAAIHSESGCLYMGYLVLLSCWHRPSRKESSSSACEVLCWWPPTQGCPLSSSGSHSLMALWHLSLAWALEVVTKARHRNVVWYPIKILYVQRELNKWCPANMQHINDYMLVFSQCGPQVPNEQGFFCLFCFVSSASNILLQHKCQE